MVGKMLLLVEDDAGLREVISDYFINDGFNVTEAESGLEALHHWEKHKFDLVLLDIMLPQLDGFSLCRKFRSTSDTPIIIITARGDDDDKLIGYELGADDYVTKPFSPRVLLAKAKNLMRRVEGAVSAKDDTLTLGHIAVNPLSRRVTVDGERAELSPKEYDLLMALIENRNRVMSRDMLLNKVWGYDYFGDLRTVDTHVKKLRVKLGTGAGQIATHLKVGYKFEEEI